MSYDEKRFSDLIYDILHHSDLETVSAKKIRTALSEKLGYDVGEYKVGPFSFFSSLHHPQSHGYSHADPRPLPRKQSTTSLHPALIESTLRMQMVPKPLLLAPLLLLLVLLQPTNAKNHLMIQTCQM
jgi:hypothetical protein